MKKKVFEKAKKYRYLKEGETVQRTDQFLRPSTGEWVFCGEATHGTIYKDGFLTVRRENLDDE